MNTITLASYVSDHRFGDRPLMPGVLSLELLLAAASQALDRPADRLTHLTFHRPAWADRDGTLRTQLRCKANEHGLVCQLFTAGGDGEWLEHASATAGIDGHTPPPALDLDAVRRRCNHVLPPADLYRALADRGMNYGPTLRSVRHLSHNGSEVFAELCPPDGDDEGANCRLHPALMDGSLQALAALAIDNGDGSGLHLPYAAEAVRVYAPVQGRTFAHGTRQGDADRSTADVTLTDDRGRVLAELRGLRARAVPASVVRSVVGTLPPSAPAPAVSNVRILRPVWKPTPAPAAVPTAGVRVVFADASGVGAAVVRQFPDAVVVTRGDTFNQSGPNQFALDPDQPDDYARLWQTLQAAGTRPTEVIHCWACDAGGASAGLLEQSTDAFFSLVHLTRTLWDVAPKSPLTLRVVTADCQSTGPADACSQPVGAMAWGLARVISKEYTPWRVQCLDLPADRPAGVLFPDLMAAATDAEVAFRGGVRLTPSAEAVPAVNTSANDLFRAGGVYVITGGVGGIGLALAKWLQQRYTGAKLVLVSRSATPQAVAHLGENAEAVAVDVADAAAVGRLLAGVRQKHGRIDAIFHAAGLVRDALLQRKSMESMAEVFRPKVLGALALDAARGDTPVVYFTSVVGWLGNAGQADYAAANRFLDSLAVYGTAQGRPARSVAFGPWAEVGMAAALAAALKSRGVEMLDPTAALDALARAVSGPDVQTSIVALPSAAPATLAPMPVDAPPASSRFALADVQRFLAAELAKFLEVDAAHIPPDAKFQDFGIDSISAVQMLRHLETATGLSLPPTLLFDHADLPSLAGHLHRNIEPSRLEALLGGGTPVAEPPPPPVVVAGVCDPGRPGLTEAGYSRGHNTPTESAPTPTFDAPTVHPVPPTGAAEYATRVRPMLAERLVSIGLDKQYRTAVGDVLEYDAGGRTVRVLDLVGGYGSTLFGHNHPELLAALHGAYVARVPTHVQVSLRGASGALAAELSRRVGAFTGREYTAVFGNSGAEVIEAALKHAVLQYFKRAEAWGKAQRQAVAVAVHGWKADPPAELPLALIRGLADVPGFDATAVHDLRGVLTELERVNRATLEAAPRFVAVRRSFHGKTAGALRLTYNPDYHVGGATADEVEFLDPNDVRRLREVVARETKELYTLVSDGGTPRLKRHSWCRIAAIFLEPIQGEGGVYPLSAEFVGEVRDLADRHAFPLVLDEIQCGMGRSGTFTAGEGVGLRGDYYAFSKALGGGLSKLGVLLIDREHAVPEFAGLHSSTFAEDDPACLVALAALKLLDRDRLAERCAAWGADVLTRLRAVRREFPDVIADVRGRGCLLGIELVDPTRSASPLFRQTGPFLGLLAASYLLNVHDIRVMPTSSAPLTLRVEPSAYLSADDTARFLAAFRQLCVILSRANAAQLVRHLVTADALDPFAAVADWSDRPTPEVITPLPGEPRVAFFSYFLTPPDIAWWEPSLAELPEPLHGELIRRFSRVGRPGIARRVRIHSATGRTAVADVVGFMTTSDQLAEALRADDLGWIRGQINEQIDRCVSEGVSAVGLGGYLSIVTGNAVLCARPDIGLTTGNALTVHAGMEVWRDGCRTAGVDLATCRVAVVGAYGNIGSTYSRLVAEEAGRVLLVGRRDSRPRLRTLAAELFADAFDKLQAGIEHGVAARLKASRVVNERLPGGPLKGGEAAELFAAVERELGADCPLAVTDDLNDLRYCRAILSASNSPEPIIHAEHLGTGRVVVCDVAVPSDVHPDVTRDRPDALVLSGGQIRLPAGQRPGLCGLHMAPDRVFACLGETLLLGLSRYDGHLSFGPVSTADVHTVARLAREHGFAVSTASEAEG